MSKKHKLHRASQQKHVVQPPQKPAAAEPARLIGRAKLAWIEAETQKIFLAEGGAQYELMLRTGQITLEMALSQMIEGRDGGPKSHGPDMSPYEERMTRGLHARIMRERRSHLREIRQRLEKALAEEAAALDAQAVAEAAQDEVDTAHQQPEQFEAGTMHTETAEPQLELTVAGVPGGDSGTS